MGPVEEIMDVVHTRYKRNIDTIEKYYINHETSRSTQINDKNTTSKNRILYVVMHHDTQ
jgi:hypothetical protein